VTVLTVQLLLLNTTKVLFIENVAPYSRQVPFIHFVLKSVTFIRLNSSRYTISSTVVLNQIPGYVLCVCKENYVYYNRISGNVIL
jgi:hypothetical protein